MKLKREIFTMSEALFDALKANGTTTDNLQNIFNDIITDFEKAIKNGDESEIALEHAIDVFLGECGYQEASDSVKDFLGLDEERYYSV